MFKNTMNVTALKTCHSDLAKLGGDEAIQILHRGHEVKVIITQERFFALLAAEKIAFLSNEDRQPVKPSLEEMRDKARSHTRKLLNIQNEEEKDTSEKEAM